MPCPVLTVVLALILMATLSTASPARSDEELLVRALPKLRSRRELLVLDRRGWLLNAYNAVKSGANKIKEGVQNAWEKTKEGVEGAWTKLKEGAKETWEDAKTIVGREDAHENADKRSGAEKRVYPPHGSQTFHSRLPVHYKKRSSLHSKLPPWIVPTFPED